MTIFMEKLLEAAIAQEETLVISAPRAAIGKFDKYDGERFLNLFFEVTFTSESYSPLALVGDFYVENQERMDAMAARNWDSMDTFTSERMAASFASTAAWIVGAALREQGRTIGGLMGVSPELESALAFYGDRLRLDLFHVASLGRQGTTAEELDMAVRNARFNRLPHFNGITSRMSETTRFHHVAAVLDVSSAANGSEAWSYAIQELSDAYAAGHVDLDGLQMLSQYSKGMSQLGFKEVIKMVSEGMPMEYAKAAAREG